MYFIEAVKIALFGQHVIFWNASHMRKSLLKAPMLTYQALIEIKISVGVIFLSTNFVYASSEGSGESVHDPPFPDSVINTKISLEE